MRATTVTPRQEPATAVPDGLETRAAFNFKALAHASARNAAGDPGHLGPANLPAIARRSGAARLLDLDIRVLCNLDEAGDRRADVRAKRLRSAAHRIGAQ